MKRIKVALVTGATGGIGAAVARRLGSAGVGVYLTGRSRQKLNAVGRSIPARRLIGTAAADLLDPAAIKKLIHEFSSCASRLDVLVHCAGQYDWSEPGSLDSKSFDRLFAVNVRAPYLLTQGLTLPLARARGQVILLNSSIVKNAGQGLAVYKATQHGMQGFTDSLRQDLNRRRVRVSSLFPGRTATPRMRRIYGREGKPYRASALLSAQNVAELVLALTLLPPRIEVTDVHLRSVSTY